MEGFSKTLWPLIETGIFARIMDHPFLVGLTDGTLPEKSFRYYVIQDALYLKEFGRGLALLAARSGEPDTLMLLSDHAKNTILVERALHAGFLEGWDLDTNSLATFLPAPNNLSYCSWLLRNAYDRPYFEALGAYLPCYWVYWEVGKALVKQGSPNSLYQRWIDTYAGDAFAGVVREMLSEVDRACTPLTDAQRDAVATNFVQGCRYEYLFWDMAWHCQQWPV